MELEVRGFSKTEVFDSNLLPLPFQAMKIIERNANGDPTQIDFFQDIIVNPGGSWQGTLVMTMYLTWDGVNVDSVASKVLKTLKS